MSTPEPEGLREGVEALREEARARMKGFPSHPHWGAWSMYESDLTDVLAAHAPEADGATGERECPSNTVCRGTCERHTPLRPATPDAGDATTASEGLTEAERETLLDCRSPGALDHALIPDVTFAAVERIVAAREAAAATRARAEGAEQALREAAENVREGAPVGNETYSASQVADYLDTRADSIARSAS